MWIFSGDGWFTDGAEVPGIAVQLRFKAVTGAVRFPVMDKIQCLKWKITYSTHQVLFLFVFFIVSYSFFGRVKCSFIFLIHFWQDGFQGFWLYELMTDPINRGQNLAPYCLALWQFEFRAEMLMVISSSSLQNRGLKTSKTSPPKLGDGEIYMSPPHGPYLLVKSHSFRRFRCAKLIHWSAFCHGTCHGYNMHSATARRQRLQERFCPRHHYSLRERANTSSSDASVCGRDLYLDMGQGGLVEWLLEPRGGENETEKMKVCSCQRVCLICGVISLRKKIGAS